MEIVIILCLLNCLDSKSLSFQIQIGHQILGLGIWNPKKQQVKINIIVGTE
jgi:hypothetical protein